MLSVIVSCSIIAQEEPLVKPLRSKKLLGQGQTAEDKQVASEGEGVVPYSNVIRDVEPPYEDILQPIHVGGTESAKLGSGGAAKFHANFLRGVRFNTPFRRGFRPEDAEFKLGNFYLDITDVSGALLASDNINLEEKNTDAGVIALTRLNVQALYQFGESFRIALRGTLAYFPLKNRFGVVGFGLEDPLADFEYFPLTAVQVAYDLNVGHWEVQLYDNLSASIQRFNGGLSYDLFNGETFDEQDQAGRYRLRPPTIVTGSGSARDRNSKVGSELWSLNNTVGVTASRIVPTDTRVELGAYHQDVWYYGAAKEHQKLPRTEEAAFINLINERESVRFKPFALYKIYRYNYDSDWNQRFRAGVRGPITDYIDFLGDVGFYRAGESDSTTLVWRLRLEHQMTPNFFHRLQFVRDVTDPDHDIENTLSYRLRYRVNPDLWAEAFAMRSYFEDLDNTLTESWETRAGVRFTYQLAQRLQMRVGFIYNDIDYVNRDFADAVVWTSRLEFLYRYSQTLEARLTYQYQTRDSDKRNDSYDENLVILSVIKYL